MRRRVIMGGSPSTGSSLLVNILDRHSAISAGSETYLFMHPRLFENWNYYKRYLKRTSKWRGLKSESWFRMNGAKLLNEDYGWSAPELEMLIEDSPDLIAFAQGFMARRMLQTGAKLWIEKSPANTISFPRFLAAFPNPAVITTIRHPFDTAASLVARGMSPYCAAGAYIVHTAMALRVWEHPRSFTVRYEDLVLQPERTVGNLLAFMGLNQEARILVPNAEEIKLEVKMKGWLQNEKGMIGHGSLGRFAQLSEMEKKRIADALSTFEINPAYARRYEIKHTCLYSISEVLGYSLAMGTGHPDLGRIKKQKRIDQVNRALRLYPAFGKYYPGSLRYPRKDPGNDFKACIML